MFNIFKILILILKYIMLQVIQGFSLADFRKSADVYKNLIRKSVAWSLYGVAESDVQDISVSSAPTAVSRYKDSTSTEVEPTVSLKPNEPSWSSVEKIEGEMVKGSIFHVASEPSVSISLTVSVENSAYSYDEFNTQLLTAWENGGLDMKLRDYAAYLDIPQAVNAKTTLAKTEVAQLSDSSSSHPHHASPSTTAIITTIVILCGFIALMAVMWYFKDSLNMKRIG